MSKLERVWGATCPVVNVNGVLLSVHSSISYITVDKKGNVKGWNERPYLDEDFLTWEGFGEEFTRLAKILPPTKDVIEKIIEVYV